MQTAVALTAVVFWGCGGSGSADDPGDTGGFEIAPEIEILPEPEPELETAPEPELAPAPALDPEPQPLPAPEVVIIPEPTPESVPPPVVAARHFDAAVRSLLGSREARPRNSVDDMARLLQEEMATQSC